MNEWRWLGFAWIPSDGPFDRQLLYLILVCSKYKKDGDTPVPLPQKSSVTALHTGIRCGQKRFNCSQGAISITGRLGYLKSCKSLLHLKNQCL